MISLASLIAQLLKNWPAKQETQVQSRGQEDPQQPTAVLLPGESHGLRSLAGYSPWDCKELDMTDQLTFLLSLSAIFVTLDKLSHPSKTQLSQLQNGYNFSHKVK